MTADSGVGAVKEKIRALKAEKADEKEAGKRKVLRRRINRLKKKTRKLSREAKVQAQSAAAAEATQAAAPAAAATAPTGAAAAAETPAPAEAAAPAQEAASAEAPAPAEDAPEAAPEPEVHGESKDDEEPQGSS